MSSHSSWHALGPRGADPAAKLSRDVVQRVWGFAAPYRRLLAGLIGSVVVTALLGAVPPLLIRSLIDVGIAQQRVGVVNLLAGAIIVVAGVNALSQVATRWCSSNLGERVIFDLRVALFEHIQRMPFAFFTRTRTGALTNRLTSDLVGGHRAFTETLARVIETVLGVVVTVGAMLVLEWRLTVLSLSVAPLFVFVMRRMRGRLHALMADKADADATLSSRLMERFQVGGALLVKLLGRPDRERAAFGDAAERVRDLGVATAVYSRLFHVGFALVAGVGMGLVYLVGGHMALNDVMTVGTLVAFGVYLTQLYTPLTMMANARVDLATALVTFQRVFEVLDMPHAVADRPDADVLADPHGRVEFDGVWFRYPPPGDVTVPSLAGEGPDSAAAEGAFVLRDVSFTVEPGETVALVGPSGAGKTTVTMLVPRLYDVTAGAVRVDGHDVRDLGVDSLTAAIGMVPQDPHLFHDTVRNNLRYARPDATEEKIEEAARAAQIHQLIAALPDGYDTMVGERGYRFSGGEKQRLAIARLLLQDPAIVILDEATAHLDSESERLVQAALAEALAGRSSLVIAHRLSTVVDADHIVVVDRGRVVEHGTHAELLAAGGLYAELCRIQFGDSEDARQVTGG